MRRKHKAHESLMQRELSFPLFNIVRELLHKQREDDEAMYPSSHFIQSSLLDFIHHLSLSNPLYSDKNPILWIKRKVR